MKTIPGGNIDSHHNLVADVQTKLDLIKKAGKRKLNGIRKILGIMKMI
jgi:hypothetical protein